jgi:hypothetical protein
VRHVVLTRVGTNNVLGGYIMRRTHFSINGGLYNRSKGKMMMLFGQEQKTWFSPLQLHKITGVPLSSTRAQCRRLHRMEPPYLLRRTIGHKWHRYHYEYRIAARGLGWLARALPFMPRDEYIVEIEAWQHREGNR